MALREFRLPDPGEGLVEADIVTWRVAVGDTVEVNDIVVEVETSKSLVELPSPYAGTVAALLVEEGQTVDVGTPIIRIEDGEPSAPSAAPSVPPHPAAQEHDAGPLAAEPGTPEPATPEPGTAAGGDAAGASGGAGSADGGRVPMLVGYGPRTGESRRRPRKAAADQASEQVHADVAGVFGTTAPVSRRADDREPLQPRTEQPNGAPLPGPGAVDLHQEPVRGAVLAKPPVRKLAKDLGVDLDQVTGSGPGGVITRDDVTGFAERPAAAPAPATAVSAAAAEGDIRLPIKGVRKATAQAMVQSAFTAPHVSEWLTCDVTATMQLVERLKARRELAEVRLSPLMLVARAVCLALGRTPELNSAWDEQAQEIVLKRSVNLGIAAATPRGLVVPNVKDAQRLGLVELATAINTAVGTAREGRTQPADMAGGTFTITNIGVFGIDAGTPILNPGESGILCFGQIARRPWVVGSGAEERIEPRWVTTLAVSFDHRLADGAQGSRFLADVAGILGDPGLALLF